VGAELAHDSGISVDNDVDWSIAIASKLGSHKSCSLTDRHWPEQIEESSEKLIERSNRQSEKE
jgi:hypothetical protein